MTEPFTDELAAALYDEFFAYLRGKRIAIVGNAKFTEKQGPEIDSFDTVIRFNDYQLAGYEEWVGSRVHVWAHCRNRSDYVTKYPIDYRMCPIPVLMKYAKGMECLPPCVYAKRETRKALIECLKRPSTGLAVVHWLLEENLNFTCFGFDHFKTTHYFDDVKHRYHLAGPEEKWFNVFCQQRDVRLKIAQQACD